ncbi:MAG: hypothetical protein U0136_02980 [Bdellovibrionota bacterium]
MALEGSRSVLAHSGLWSLMLYGSLFCTLGCKGPSTDSASTQTSTDKNDTEANASAQLEMLPTGIKAIDFLAPLPVVGTAYLCRRAGAGYSVVLFELLKHFTTEQKLKAVVLYDRIKENPESTEFFKDFADVFGENSQNPKLVPFGFVGRAELRKIAEDAGVNQADFVVVVSDVEPTIRRVRQIVTGAQTGPHAEGKRNLFLVASSDYAPEDADAVIEVSRAICVVGVYPCVDPRRSFSKLLSGPKFSAQRELREKIVRRVGAYLSVYDFEDERALESDPKYRRAVRELRFFSQPFFVAEKYVKEPGVTVALADTINGFEQLENGKFDNESPTLVFMIGKISDAELKKKRLEEEFRARATTTSKSAAAEN